MRKFPWKSHEINEFLGVNAGPMNALTADGLVASLKALEGPRGERCANNAQDFAAKVKAGLGLLARGWIGELARKNSGKMQT